MPTVIKKVEHIERVWVHHECGNGRSEYNAYSDTVRDSQGVLLTIYSRDIKWPNPNQTHCMSCGEELPLTLEDVQRCLGRVPEEDT